MSQALYRKWRPGTWEEVVGQDHIVQTLKNAIATSRVGHAYLFSGPRGTGKTTTARLLAKAVNCTGEGSEKPCDICPNCQAVREGSFLDLIEIDAATNTGVDDVRDLKEKINFSPNIGKYKVYLIDEVHMFTNNAFNALLKTLEEPPAHAMFILATTDLEKVPATILSRCQRYEFRRIPISTVVGLLKKNAEAEGISIPEEVLTLIARQSTGSMRDAISLLDQLASTGRAITREDALNLLGTATHESIAGMLDALIAGEAGTAIDQLQTALDSGVDARPLARQMVDYLHGLLLAKNHRASLIDATREAQEVMEKQARKLETRQILAILERFHPLAADTNLTTWQPGLGFELALVESIESMTSKTATTQAQVGNFELKGSQATQHTKAAATAQPASGTRPVPEAPAVVNHPQQDGLKAPAQDGAASGVPIRGTDIPSVPKVVQGSADINNITAGWKKVSENARRFNPATQALVNSCRPVSLKGGVLFLAFNSPVIKEKMEKQDHLENTRQAILAVLGLDLQIRCMVSSASEGSDQTPLDGENMVSVAVRELGGRVVKVSPVKDEDQGK